MAGRTGSTSSALQGLRLPGRYEIKRHIANGGMASVWCAEDLILGRTVAIKVLAERFVEDEMAVQRFMREARAAARVSSHPHVVTIYDVGETAVGRRGGLTTPGPAFIVMEHLEGGTVAEALRRGPIHRTESLRWLEQAASALDHAHAQGIVHRDVKPANFLLDHNRSLYVADFGIARMLSEDTITRSGELFGTAAYLSPELALGRPATAAGDRYALAVAAFELLVGERPFTAEHFAAQARQHVEDPPPAASGRKPELPAAADRVLIRGMAKEPEKRYRTAGEFVAELKHALEAPRPTRRPAAALGEPVTAATRPLAAPSPARHDRPLLPRRSSGKRRLIALGALALALLGIGAIAALGGGGSPTAAESLGNRSVTHSPGTRASKHTPTAKAKTSPQATATTNTGTIPPLAQSSPDGTSSSADQLEAQGHQLLQNGSYAAAIPTLRRAVAAAAPGSLIQGYALYDLGRSLFLSGDPAAAVPVLQRRLQINNQIPVVRKLLDAALAASGQAPKAAKPAKPAPPGNTTPGNGGVGAVGSPGYHHHDHGGGGD